MAIKYQTGIILLVFNNKEGKKILVKKNYLQYFDIANKNTLFTGVNEIVKINDIKKKEFQKIENISPISQICGLIIYGIFIVNILSLIFFVSSIFSKLYFTGIILGIFTFFCGYLNVVISEYFEKIFVHNKLKKLGWKLQST